MTDYVINYQRQSSKKLIKKIRGEEKDWTFSMSIKGTIVDTNCSREMGDDFLLEFPP